VAHIIGMGIIGIDQPMLCIQLMNMCITSIICCDIILTTLLVSADTSGTELGSRWHYTLNGRPVRAMARLRWAGVRTDVHTTRAAPLRAAVRPKHDRRPALDPVPGGQTTARIRRGVVDRPGRSVRFRRATGSVRQVADGHLPRACFGVADRPFAEIELADTPLDGRRCMFFA
jgi:hypothetical protein